MYVENNISDNWTDDNKFIIFIKQLSSHDKFSNSLKMVTNSYLH